MHALVYEGPGKRSWTSVPDPSILEDSDAIVRIDTTTICGTDLHILKGDVPEVSLGRVLGHEAVGTVTEIGKAVRSVAVGDRVLVSCVSPCGRCRFCRSAQFGQCLNGGGWIFGYMVDGLQAEYARIPFADNTLYHLPDGITDEQAVYLSDVLPTSYEVGVLNGHVQPGDVVAVVGGGPIGLSAILTAGLFSPAHIVAIDPDANRRELALQCGADVAVAPEAARSAIDAMTENLGADVAIEAVGLPATFEHCTTLIRPGGRIANIGVHGKPVALHLETLWKMDVTITTGLVDTRTIPTLMKAVESGKLDATALTTHHFALDDIMAAYDAYSHAAESGAIKVMVSAHTPATQPELTAQLLRV